MLPLNSKTPIKTDLLLRTYNTFTAMVGLMVVNLVESVVVVVNVAAVVVEVVLFVVEGSEEVGCS